MSDDAMGHVCPPSSIKFLNSALRRRLQNFGKYFAPLLKPGDTAFDLGCGGGIYSVELAKIVGPEGRVIAVDLQAEVLDIAREYVRRKGFADRITFHQCEQTDLGITEPKADLAVAVYVVHEVPDRAKFFGQVFELLKPGAHFLVTEPAWHVSRVLFQKILADGEAAGLTVQPPPKIRFSRTMLFGREG